MALHSDDEQRADAPPTSADGNGNGDAEGHGGNGHKPPPSTLPSRLPLPTPPGEGPRRGTGPFEINWDKWSRHVESRRRKLTSHPFDSPLTSRDHLAEATYASFRLDGLDVTEADVAAALSRGARRRAFRPRASQRVRNHVAVLRAVDARVLTGQPLDYPSVLRWYAAVNCGLCPADLDDAAAGRLTTVLHRMNSPELRLAAAVQGVARLHAAALADPLFPSFNGILARALLRFHLGRCGLPPIFFHPDTPPAALAAERTLLPMVMELLERSFDALVGTR